MSEAIHVAITRKIKPGSEAEFERAIQQFFAKAAMSPGSLGAQLIRPLPGSANNTYGILRSFASEQDREAFYRSDQFRQWERTVRPIVENEYSRRDLHGLEAFFSDPDIVKHPPRWKMAVVTWIGVWPTVFLVAGLASPYLTEWPAWLATGAITLLVVAALTWAVMPVLTRLTRWWLRKS
jgi:antibiotic biosynthesis monooxygenase (ABM) superfamily enzyme